MDRHYFWTNFHISPFEVKRSFNINNARACTRQTPDKDFDNLTKFHGIILGKEVKDARKMLRNCVYPPLGLHILNSARKEVSEHWREDNPFDRKCTCDKAEPVTIYTSYGGGWNFDGKACRNCMVITKGKSL